MPSPVGGGASEDSRYVNVECHGMGPSGGRGMWWGGAWAGHQDVVVKSRAILEDASECLNSVNFT